MCPHDHEMVECFLLDALNKPLHEGVRVRRSEGSLPHFDPGVAHLAIHLFRELGIAIVGKHGLVFGLAGAGMATYGGFGR